MGRTHIPQQGTFSTSLTFVQLSPTTNPDKMAMMMTSHVQTLRTADPAVTRAKSHAASSSAVFGRPCEHRASSAPKAQRASLNVVASEGIFAPIVVFCKDSVGIQKFNKFRGKAIQIHSQVIGEFVSYMGGEKRLQQQFIKKAKKNGHDLGFLA